MPYKGARGPLNAHGFFLSDRLGRGPLVQLSVPHIPPFARSLVLFVYKLPHSAGPLALPQHLGSSHRRQPHPFSASRCCIRRGSFHRQQQFSRRHLASEIYTSNTLHAVPHPTGDTSSPCATSPKTTTSTHHVSTPACTSSALRSTVAGSALAGKDLMSGTSCCLGHARSATDDAPVPQFPSTWQAPGTRRFAAVRSSVQSQAGLTDTDRSISTSVSYSLDIVSRTASIGARFTTYSPAYSGWGRQYEHDYIRSL